MQGQNQYDAILDKQCHTGYGMYKVSSNHHNYYEDRIWRFECRKVADKLRGQPSCSTTDYVNNFDEEMSFSCGSNKYIQGVYSYHNNHYEDRRWKFTCCSIPDHPSSSCRLTSFLNEFDTDIDFEAGRDELITGIFSVHSNHAE